MLRSNLLREPQVLFVLWASRWLPFTPGFLVNSFTLEGMWNDSQSRKWLGLCDLTIFVLACLMLLLVQVMRGTELSPCVRWVMIPTIHLLHVRIKFCIMWNLFFFLNLEKCPSTSSLVREDSHVENDFIWLAVKICFIKTIALPTAVSFLWSLGMKRVLLNITEVGYQVF